jgi:hypothetical protein
MLAATRYVGTAMLDRIVYSETGRMSFGPVIDLGQALRSRF